MRRRLYPAGTAANPQQRTGVWMNAGEIPAKYTGLFPFQPTGQAP